MSHFKKIFQAPVVLLLVSDKYLLDWLGHRRKHSQITSSGSVDFSDKAKKCVWDVNAHVSD